MKQSGTTTVFVIVCVAVLLGSWGIGLCIRQVRFRSAGIESKAGSEPEMSAEIQKPGEAVEAEREPAEMAQFRPERRPMPGGEGRRPFGDLSEEQRERMRERFENMSEEERQKFRPQMRGRFGGRRPQGGDRFGDLSEEERAERESMRERLENMSEEEREEFRVQMRERFGGRRPQGDGEGGRRRPGARRRPGDSGGGAPPPKGRACFVAETPVWVDGKLVQISKVTTGQTVGKKFCGSSSLEQVQEHEGTFECRDIALESGNTIGVVDAHCFMLDSGRWIAAQNLTSGLRLKTLTGTVGIKSVTKRAVPYTGKVYNLKVKSSDQYMVGKDVVIVRDY